MPDNWSDGGDVLPELQVVDLIHTLKKMSNETGLSWEGFHPKWVLQLPAEHMQRILDILHAWEESPAAIRAWVHTAIFIPKKSGGRRPII